MRPVDILPGSVFLAVSGVGLAGVLAANAMHTSVDLPWWNGEWGAKWEKILDHDVFFREPSVTAWAIVEYSLFQEGRPGVLVGDDGWLFTNEEFLIYPHDAATAAENARVVLAAAAEINARGAGLLVVVIPAKSRLEADHLGRHVVPAAVAARSPAFVGVLEKSKIDVLNLQSALEAARQTAQVFLRTDTHWTPEGAEAAAAAIRGHVQEKGAAWLDSAVVNRTAGPSARHSGDLLRYIPLGPWQDTLGPQPDTISSAITQVVAGGDLLGDATIPVTLVGTSYSDDARWGFLGSLQVALRADVLNAAAQGKGPFVSMAAYLQDDAWTTNPPQLVIWEIPERYIGVAYDLHEYSFWEKYGKTMDEGG